MRSDEFYEDDLPSKIDRDDQPIITTRDFESHTLAAQNLCIRSRLADLIHRSPSGSFN
jgi:hypothetical protein